MKLRLHKLNQYGFDHAILAVALVVVIGVGGTFLYLHSYAETSLVDSWSGEIQSGLSSSLCMENEDNSKTANNSAVTGNCNGSASQEWTIERTSSGANEFELVAKTSGACLEDLGGAKGNQVGTNASNRVYVATEACKATQNQLWKWTGSNGYHELGTTFTSGSNGCLNILGDTTKPLTNLIVYTCESGALKSSSNEFWYQEPLKATTTTTTTTTTTSSSKPVFDSSYPFAVWFAGLANSTGTHYCLDDYQGLTNTKADVYLCNGKTTQSWEGFIPSGTKDSTSTGIQFVLGSNTDVCLGTSGNGTANNTPVTLSTCNNSTSGQLWKSVKEAVSGGAEYELENAHSGKCLNDPNSSLTDGTQFVVYTCNQTKAQLYEPVVPDTSTRQ